MVGASLLLGNRVRSRKVNDSTLRFPLCARNARACGAFTKTGSIARCVPRGRAAGCRIPWGSGHTCEQATERQSTIHVQASQ